MAIALIHFIFGIIIGITLLLVISRIKESRKGRKDDSENESPSTEDCGDTIKKENQENDQNLAKTISKYEGMNNVDLMKAILRDINCQYTETSKGQLIFTYQGENFAIIDSPDSVWIRIIDLQWYTCPLDNIEEMSCMQKAINESNATQTCTALYDIDRDDHKMIVYSKYDMVISLHTDQPDMLLEACLADFFRLKHKIGLEFDKERQRMGVV